MFYLCIRETGLSGIFVASDFTRNKLLFEVGAKDIIKIFQRAADGEDAISMNYDSKKQDYVIRLPKKQRNRV
jgi:hypothetical protein